MTATPGDVRDDGAECVAVLDVTGWSLTAAAAAMAGIADEYEGAMVRNGDTPGRAIYEVWMPADG